MLSMFTAVSILHTTWSLVVENRSDAVFWASTGHVLCRSDLGSGSTPRRAR